MEASHAQPPSDAGGKRHLPSIALGIERIGLVPLRHPFAVSVATILIVIAASLGITRLQVDDSLSQLFRSDTPQFRQYEEVTKRFPSSEFDVLARTRHSSASMRK
jgi:predicted RND superfamily exporter protein